MRNDCVLCGRYIAIRWTPKHGRLQAGHLTLENRKLMHETEKCGKFSHLPHEHCLFAAGEWALSCALLSDSTMIKLKLCIRSIFSGEIMNMLKNEERWSSVADT